MFHVAEIVTRTMSSGMMVVVVEGWLAGWRAVRGDWTVLGTRSTDIVTVHLISGVGRTKVISIRCGVALKGKSYLIDEPSKGRIMLVDHIVL